MAPADRTTTKDALAREVGARIRDLREARGLSLGDVHAATGIDPSNLSKIERGESLTDLGRYSSIAAALGVALATLFRGLGGQPHARGA